MTRLPSQDRSSPHSHLSDVAAGLLVIVWSLIRVPPWCPGFVFESDGVDPSWLALLNEAVPRRWHFGSDILFTYGPLGFLHGQFYHPETYFPMMVGWAIVAWALATNLWTISGQVCEHWLARLLGVVVIIDMLSRDVMALCFGLQILLFLRVVPLQHIPCDVVPDATPSTLVRRYDATNKWLLLLLVAVLPWVKFSYLVSVFGLVGCVGIAAALQRRLPIESGMLMIGSLAAWFATGHSRSDLVGYLLYGFELARGYSIAMGTSPSSVSGWIALTTAALIIPLLAVWFSRRAYDERRMRRLATLFLLGVLFVIWKSTFVRWHPAKLTTFLAPILLLVLAGWRCNAGKADRGAGRLAARLLGTTVCLFGVACFVCWGARPDQSLVNWWSAPAAVQRQAIVRTARNPTWLRTLHRERMEEIRKANPVPEIAGSVDVFPSQLITALAHRLDLRPRPVIQSYAAYSDRLLTANQSHFNSDLAPDHVLLTISSIDNRLPMMDDGPTWRELVRRYQPVTRVDDVLRLDRLPFPRDWQRELVVSQTLEWNRPWHDDALRLDAEEGWLLCRIDCHPNLVGQLATTLYRLPSVNLRITTGKHTHDFRLIPACARAGFLLSPLVTTSDDCCRLWQPWPENSALSMNLFSPAGDDEVQALTVTTPLEQCFDKRITLKLWRLTPRQPTTEEQLDHVTQHPATGPVLPYK